MLHEYIKEQLGRDDEESLRLWSDVLYRDDCTLDYNDRGKPYHHKGIKVDRVINTTFNLSICRFAYLSVYIYRSFLSVYDWVGVVIEPLRILANSHRKKWISNPNRASG